MKILIIEPFFTGSHKKWAEEYQEKSKHEIKILSLPGRFWKWRMHGAAITLAKRYRKLNFSPNLIITTDMLNLPVFQSLINPTCPIVMYFHENQFTYPWSPDDKDVELNRDKHYGFINYSSALSAHHIYFNSQFHLDSFFNGLEIFLKQFPDYREMQNIDLIKKKSSVLHLGLDLKKFDKFISKKSNEEPIILWNHRWEYDKNPELFFETLQKISKQGSNFKLVVLGEEFTNELSCFTQAKNSLKKHILQFGYATSFNEYANWLWKADILPVTSEQDFFGGSIIEAVYCNNIPLLPNRLTYPELFNYKNNSNLFYENKNDLLAKLDYSINNFNNLKQQKHQMNTKKFDWRYMVRHYDDTFEKFI